jgi:hypothetical protein
MRASGHVRSGSSTAICSWKGRYLWTGIELAVWVFLMVFVSPREWWSANDELRDE